MSSTRRSSILLGQAESSAFQRMTARGIDLLILLGIYLVGKAIWVPLGPICGAAYAAMQDGLGDGQSFGKRMMGLRVMDDSTGGGCSVSGSVIRNLPVWICVLIIDIPALWYMGLALVLLVGSIELFLLLSISSGVRWGDVLANTLVVEHFNDGLDEVSRGTR